VLVAAVYVLRTIVIQLILAIVLAMAAEPLVSFFERRGAPRGHAVGISIVLVAIVLSAFGYLLSLCGRSSTSRHGSSHDARRSCSTSREATAGVDSPRRATTSSSTLATPSTRAA
jgi:hypothetical protein